ncbi:MAG: hypothetical protein K0R36_900 [Chryseobacterium sp.]|jgi:hypothetical protein|nr:hypothetical protein [Chryseobacterium sp.]
MIIVIFEKLFNNYHIYNVLKFKISAKMIIISLFIRNNFFAKIGVEIKKFTKKLNFIIFSYSQ